MNSQVNNICAAGSLIRATERIFRISQKRARTVTQIYFINKFSKNCDNHQRMYIKYFLIFKTFNKYSSCDTIPWKSIYVCYTCDRIRYFLCKSVVQVLKYTIEERCTIKLFSSRPTYQNIFFPIFFLLQVFQLLLTMLQRGSPLQREICCCQNADFLGL